MISPAFSLTEQPGDVSYFLEKQNWIPLGLWTPGMGKSCHYDTAAVILITCLSMLESQQLEPGAFSSSK